VNPPRAPLGTYSSRCDDKGRVRIPKELEVYMRALPDPEFFLTTWEGSIGKIYPRTVWEHNLEVLARTSDESEDLARFVDHFGSIATLDAQARLLVSPELRRELGIENQQVFLRCAGASIEIYSEAAERASLERARTSAPDVLKKLRRMEGGLK
jgi:DNA-binding transcriptional regulator/RsmH inhibitor MraZ